MCFTFKCPWIEPFGSHLTKGHLLVSMIIELIIALLGVILVVLEFYSKLR